MTKLNSIAFVLICGIVVGTVLLYGTVHQPIISLFYLTTVILAVVWAADGVVRRKLTVSSSWLQVPLLALGVYALVQVIPFDYGAADELSAIPRTISVFPFATQVTGVHILILSVFFAVVLACVQSAGRLRRIATVITIFGFVYAFYAILQSVLSPGKIYGIYETGYATPFGSFVNRHQYAALMEMVTAVPLGLLFTGALRRDKRLLYILAVVLMGSSLMLSGSRGGSVAMICEVIVLVILTAGGKGGKNLALKAVLSFALLVAIVVGAVFVGGDTSLTRLAETASSQDITSNRTHIWGVTLRVVSSNLPLGAGVGAFTQAYTRFDTLSGLEQVEQAHNDYLQILADAGLAGLIIGAAFLFLFFREGIRGSRRHNTFRRGIAIGAFAGCIAILIHSLFDFVLHTTAISVMFLTLLAMIIAAGRQYPDDITEFEESPTRHRSASVTQIRGGRR